MKSFASDLKDLLVAGGMGTFAATSGWSINIASEPVSPNSTITIYDTTGPDPLRCSNASVDPLFRPHAQVRVRSAPRGYDTGYAKALAIRDLLDQKTQHRASSDTTVQYQSIFQIGDIALLEKDEKDRYVFTMNFVGVRTRVS